MKKPETKQVGEWIRLSADRLAAAGLFFGHGTDNPGAEVQWLVVNVLNRDGLKEINEQTRISPENLDRLESLLKRRIKDRIPMAYLLQEAWFAGHCFYVDERVLVPRSPTAELVENRFMPLLTNEPDSILDMCCGSGCIGIACALAFPECHVVLADISPEALAVARINIARFGLEDRVKTVQADLFEGIVETFDLIISNPPYVSDTEYRELPKEYHREPMLGLVSKQEGLEIPLHILAQAVRYLSPKGALILETGYTWKALDQALLQMPFLWLDFEYGGEGVCFLSSEQLRQYYQDAS